MCPVCVEGSAHIIIFLRRFFGAVLALLRLLENVEPQRGRRVESTYDKLFGTELYSNAAVLAQTAWQPRIRLEDVIGQIADVGSAGL